MRATHLQVSRKNTSSTAGEQPRFRATGMADVTTSIQEPGCLKASGFVFFEISDLRPVPAYW